MQQDLYRQTFIPGPKQFAPDAKYDVPILLLEYVGPIAPVASSPVKGPEDEAAKAKEGGDGKVSS